MHRNSLFNHASYNEDNARSVCASLHMQEEPYLTSASLTDEFISSLTEKTVIPVHKIYFKYDAYNKIIGLEVEKKSTIQWIDSFSVFYDFPLKFRIEIYKLFPNKVFACAITGIQSLEPEVDLERRR